MYRFRAEVWLYQGENPWHFLTLPPDVSDEIEGRSAAGRRGFGSVRVTVVIGVTRWSTSIFPDKAAGAYVLPLKAAVRRAEGITAGDSVIVELDVVETGGGDHP
jgi:hypothetical protein